jgi:hypothetical protein
VAYLPMMAAIMVMSGAGAASSLLNTGQQAGGTRWPPASPADSRCPPGSCCSP